MKLITLAIAGTAAILWAGTGLAAAGTVVTTKSATNVAVEKTTITHADAAAAAKLVAAKSLVVLDLRTPKEFGGGHVPGAVNLDCLSPDFGKQLDALDKSEKYLVYCASGRRSTHSLPQFQKRRFESLVHLDGGIAAWKRAGEPLEK